jgi:hypothetical protein
MKQPDIMPRWRGNHLLKPDDVDRLYKHHRQQPLLSLRMAGVGV